MLYDGNTVYETLGGAGVKSFVFLPEAYKESAYSQAVQKGSERVPYRRASDLAGKLRTKVQEEQGPAYLFVYWPEIDSASHIFGPASEEAFAEASLFSYVFEEEFLGKISPKDAENILVMLTADHGQVPVNPLNVKYLKRGSEIEKLLKKNTAGNTIGATGSPRDIFLFWEQQEEGMKRVQDFVGENGKVLNTKEALEKGLFGLGVPSERFQRRIGDLLILPELGHEIWYEHISGKPFSLLGHHGGLSEEEMVIPFVVARLEELIKNDSSNNPPNMGRKRSSTR